MARSGVVLGVDGCPGGWVGALVRPATGDLRWHLLSGAAPALRLAELSGAAAVAVDVPIGLPAGAARTCDRSARALLGRRGVTVFPAPLRGMLDSPTYAAACALSRAARGVAIPLQTWHLLAGIRDWDAALTPGLQRTVVEAHPELSFAALAGGPLEPKRSARGAAQRSAVLAEWLPGLPAALPARPRPARTHDALDAVVLAWTAARWAAATATVHPAEPERDERGLRMEIVA